VTEEDHGAHPFKARAGIGALTFAAAVAPFVLATPAKAINIKFIATKRGGLDDY
jgi:hypothetical protein